MVAFGRCRVKGGLCFGADRFDALHEGYRQLFAACGVVYGVVGAHVDAVEAIDAT